MKPKDHYATLGVGHQAPQADIKRAYRKLARKFHPDVSQEPNALAQFQAVAEAHEVLIDPERRAAYDAEVQGTPPRASRRPHGPNNAQENSGSQAFSDFFDAIRSHSRNMHSEPHVQRGADEHANIDVSLRDAYRESTQQLMVHLVSLDSDEQPHWTQRELEVRIPRGVREGQRLRLKGQGAPGLGGAPPGDLYLTVRFATDPEFRLDGRDVLVDLMLAPWEAALGAKVQARTPEGPVELTVPAGSRPLRKLRLKGRGLPGRPSGDLYAVLGIALPPPHSSEQHKAYEALASAFPSFNARQAAPA